ncbi:hypothetical protein [Ureibacillus sp. FSL K6-2830]|uniref:hypothetical protein n=1 Tax=Ureibacillus sp. FSL K6-2830 TaxID=2954610 RepID=UPI0030F67DDF
MTRRKIIPISLNLNDEIDLRLLEHLNKKGNRSKYLKRLIYDDLMGVKKLITTAVHVEEEHDEDLDSMKGFL